MIRKEFILSELKYRYPEVTSSIREPRQQVGRPLFFEGAGKSVGARIIVCAPNRLDGLIAIRQREPLFLCLGMPSEQALSALDICVLPQNEDAPSVMNFVQRLFDRLDEWTLQLKQTAETAMDIGELLERAAEMLQNPVCLLDERRHVVAQSEQFDAVDIDSYILPECDADQTKTERSAMLRPAGKGGVGALASTLIVGGVCYSLLCKASERALYGSDEVVFESLAGYVRLMLSERKLGARAPRLNQMNDAAEQAFRSLFSQDAPEQPAVDALSRIGWPESGEYCVLAAEPADRDLRPAQAGALCELLETSMQNCCAFAISSVVAALVRIDQPETPQLLKTLLGLSEQSGARFGVCEAVRGFALLPQRLALAKLALDRAERLSGVAAFSDAAEAYVAGRSTAEFPAELICLRPVLAMAAYDREHETNYVKTTERYVQNRFNAVRTAGELFIHRSTFLYRLERIRTQFGLDFEDESVSLLHLLLSLRLVRGESIQNRI